MTLTKFTSFLNGMAEGFSGFPSFKDLSSDTWSTPTSYSPAGISISAFAFMLDTPVGEDSGNSPTDSNSFKEFHSSNPGWLTTSNNIKSGIPTINILNSRYQMNFRYISTPETTYALVYAYDQNNPDACPKNAVKDIQNIFSDFSDNIIVKKNRDATAESFKKELKNGIDNYRYVIFYEFSHGKSEHITLRGGLYKSELFDILATAKCRVFGMFDSCHSESMINDSKADGQNKFVQAASNDYTLSPSNWNSDTRSVSLASTNRENSQLQENGFGDSDDSEEPIIDYLINRLNKHFSELGTAATVDSSDKPLVMLWSSTGASHYGWYYPRSGTVFASAVAKAYDECKGNRLTGDDGFWTKTQKYGKSHTNESKSSINYCCPCLRTFEPDNEPENKLLYLIGLS